MMLSIISAALCLYICCLQRISAAGGHVSGHDECTKIKLYPVVQLSIQLSNVAYSEFEDKVYSNKSRLEDLFHVIDHALDDAYNRTYHYPKHISSMLAHCHTELHTLESSDDDNYDGNHSDGFTLFYDMESYDADYKYKIEKLFKKSYFKDAAIHEFDHYFHDWHVDESHDHVDIIDVTVIDTSISFNDRLATIGLMIGVICAIFTISATMIAFYSKTSMHRRHLRQIADEFGFDDISEVSQITHLKLC